MLGATEIRRRNLVPSLASMAVLVLVVLLIRLALGFEFPIPWNDETAFIAQAFEFSRTGSFYVHGLNSERVVMWMPPGHMLVLAGAYKLFGYSYELSRWVSALLYLGCFAVFLVIVRDCLSGWRRNLALALLLVAFLSPYSLAIANIARMESLYTLVFLLSLLAALRGKYTLGLALVLFGAVVHYNAVYFLLPYALLVFWKIVRRETLLVGPGELLGLLLAALALLTYGLFVIKHIDGFWQDMRFQFDYKLGSAVMGGRKGWILLAAVSLVPVLQLLAHRRFGKQVLLSLYGIAFIAMTLNGHNMWYYYAYNLGFCLLLLGLLASSVELAGNWWRGCLALLFAALALQLLYYSSRSTLEFDPLKPSWAMLSQQFLPSEEIEYVRQFIGGLPPGATVSFGYTGVEPFFFADFAKVGALWSGSAHSVTEVLPPVHWTIACSAIVRCFQRICRHMTGTVILEKARTVVVGSFL